MRSAKATLRSEVLITEKQYKLVQLQDKLTTNHQETIRLRSELVAREKELAYTKKLHERDSRKCTEMQVVRHAWSSRDGSPPGTAMPSPLCPRQPAV